MDVTNFHLDLDDLIPMSFSYKGKRGGGGQDEINSQYEQELDLPAIKKVHRRANVDFLIEPSQGNKKYYYLPDLSFLSCNVDSSEATLILQMFVRLSARLKSFWET